MYSVMSIDPASPTRHRLHTMISDFTPPSVYGSGEAALRRLQAPNLVSLLSSSARVHLDMYKKRMLRPVGLGGRYVVPVFQDRRRHCVGFVRSGEGWFRRVC